MLQMSHDVAQLVAQEKLTHDLERVLVGCRLRDAGLRQSSWLAQQLCRVAWVTGRGLVATGHRLEQLSDRAYGPIQLVQASRGN